MLFIHSCYACMRFGVFGLFLLCVYVFGCMHIPGINTNTEIFKPCILLASYRKSVLNFKFYRSEFFSPSIGEGKDW